MKTAKNLLALACGVLLALGVSGAIPASAGTEPTQEYRIERIDPKDIEGPKIMAPPWDEVVCFAAYQGSTKHGESCYEYIGDDQWVHDTYNNNHQFRVHVFTEYGKSRYCADDTAGWTECKYDHKENECMAWHAYYPPHSSGDFFPSTPWISVRSGGSCSTD